MHLYWISTHFQLFITNFAKILGYLSGSRNSQFQPGKPLNGCFWNNSSTRVVKIWKWLQNISVEQCGVLLEKVIRKNYKMFWHETSMRKPFFSKATCSSAKKEFLHILIPWKSQKMSRKIKKFRKIINWACFNEYFYRYISKVDKTYLQISFETMFFKMLWADI